MARMYEDGFIAFYCLTTNHWEKKHSSTDLPLRGLKKGPLLASGDALKESVNPFPHVITMSCI